MLSAIIIDQDEESSYYLKSIISEYCPDIKIVGVATNLKEAEELVLMGDYQESQIKERTWQDQVIHKVEEIKDDE